jgi:hypothetical protein
MPSFRQRPLTWLFLIATASLDAAALATDNESGFANALALGQLFIASGWLVVGRSHRLIRAAVFVSAIGLLTAPDYVIPRLRGRFYIDLVWPHLLGMLIAMGLAAAAAAWWWLAMARLTSRGLKEFRRADWQFPLAELFGWMIVVAAASAGVRLADFSLIDSPQEIGLGLAMTALAGAIMALLLGDYQEVRRSRALVAKIEAACLIVGLIVLLAAALPPDARAVSAGALGYTACCAIVVNIDRRGASRPK